MSPAGNYLKMNAPEQAKKLFSNRKNRGPEKGYITVFYNVSTVKKMEKTAKKRGKKTVIRA